MISIRMGKVCDDSICKPLKLILESCLESGKFPSKWKKANVVPIHKKGGKQILKNYQLEKFLRGYYMIACLSFFTENSLLSDNQSGFKPGDSCINQLL